MGKIELNLRDRLSRLTYNQACKLLGDDGGKLIMKGAKFDYSNLEERVHLGKDLFRFKVDGAVVTITMMAEVPGLRPIRLRAECLVI